MSGRKELLGVKHNEKEKIWRRCSRLGMVYHMGNHAFGSDTKPNCAANEIPANTNANIAIIVVIQ